MWFGYVVTMGPMGIVTYATTFVGSIEITFRPLGTSLRDTGTLVGFWLLSQGIYNN